ncbi:hypothetical protein NXS19_000239 [Fusarium pseudograminearum]|nr:hypothetical protein NXS19_000239 [Fusarium pseudograminearum]
MCKKSTCVTCKQATWWGCGNHVPAVMSNIPEHEWCTLQQTERFQYYTRCHIVTKPFFIYTLSLMSSR